MTTSAILAKFQNSLNPDLEYGLAEMKKIFSDSFKAIKAENAPVKVKKEKKLDSNGNEKPKKTRVKRERDADGNIRKLRPPSAYNIFVKEKIAEIRANNSELVDTKEIFKMAIAAWNKSKEDKKSSDSEEAVEVAEEAVEVAEEAVEVADEVAEVADEVAEVAEEAAEVAEVAEEVAEVAEVAEEVAEVADEVAEVAEEVAEVTVVENDDDVPVFGIKKPAKKGRRPKNTVSNDNDNE